MPADASLITNLGETGAAPARPPDATITETLRQAVRHDARPLSLFLGAARTSGKIGEDSRIGERPVKPVPPPGARTGFLLTPKIGPAMSASSGVTTAPSPTADLRLPPSALRPALRPAQHHPLGFGSG
jgi:hypothetical protein